MSKCGRCHDTGIIETGNNDLPCDCPAGDTAMFNCAGEGQITGAEIKRRNSLPQMQTAIGDRTDRSNFFKWYEHPGCWLTTSGNLIIVVPPKTPIESWWCIIPHSDEQLEIRGEGSEKRAFGIADFYTHQRRVTRAA